MPQSTQSPSVSANGGVVHTPPDFTQLFQRARGMRERIESVAEQIEQQRKLPDLLADELAEAGFFKMLVPREYGGSQVSAEEYLRILEELARVDGSTAWVVGLLACNSIAAGYFPEQVSEEIFGGNSKACIAGSLAPALRGPEEPPNRAVVEGAGFRLDGAWSFASGCMHCTYMIALCAVWDGEKPRRHADGRVEQRWFFFPKGECEIVESWSTLGLRGTGSHGFVAREVFVPAERTLPASSPITPVHPGQLYAFSAGPAFTDRHIPLAGVSTSTLIGVCLGIARGMLDAFYEIAGLHNGISALKDNALVQDKIGRAEAILRAARAYQLTAVRDAWEHVRRNGRRDDDTEYLKDLTLAGAHVAVMCAESVDLVWSAAAINAVHVPGPFERRFRDIHVATQNGGITPAIYSFAARYLMDKASP